VQSTKSSSNAKLSQQNVLKIQIDQLFDEVISIWKDTDIKKIKAVKHLAARMEELYLTTGIPVNQISRDIGRRLEAAGISTWAHVSDYLESKYKRDYIVQNSNLNPNPNPIPVRGDISPNNVIEEILKIQPLIRTKDDIQYFDEYAKHIAVEAEANRQAAKTRGIALATDGHIPSKEYDKVTTENPEPQETSASDVWQSEIMPIIETFASSHKEITKKIISYPPDDEQAQAMVKPFKDYAKLLKLIFQPINEFIGPFKDLKFATSKPKWWRIVLKYFDHGKHAAAVMDAINSHKYLEERVIRILKINCPSSKCKYFATVPDNTANPLDPQARPQIKLLIDHMMDNHDKETRYLAIKVEDGKVTVQVPAERDLTREQVGDQIKELVELAIRFVSAIKALQALSQWREQFVDGRVATRRMDAREKLSDLA
jgi:hypothetical protein